MDIRKIAIIFVIGALFAILAFSTIDAIIINPEDEFCNDELRRPMLDRVPKEKADCPDFTEPAKEAYQECEDNNGYMIFQYDSMGCPTESKCSCAEGYAAAQARYEFITFILYSIFATIGVAVGVILPKSKNPLHEWVGTGFMLGGFVCLFIGTARYFEEMNRMIRPIIILVELILIVWLSYKKLGDLSTLVKGKS
jgi:hypothetical protein